jgi:antitoxin (DNA-binding transcriptional repressor) of toxin-antitoxin stability system
MQALDPRSTGCDIGFVTTTISQRELRNASGDIMRRLEAGETFIVTRAGKPVGELGPVRRHQFVNAGLVADIFRDAPGIDADRLRGDLDSLVDPSPDPRA